MLPAQKTTAGNLPEILTPRKPESHKGDFGRVLVAAGSRGMAGAAVMCAHAALKSGAGLVTVGICGSMQSAFVAALPEAMTIALPENAEGTVTAGAAAVLIAAHKKKSFDLLLIGPGLGGSRDARQFVGALIAGLKIPVVADADALNAFAASGFGPLSGLMSVCTPHAGEMARLLGCAAAKTDNERLVQAEKLCRLTDGVCVLKGNKTVVSDGVSAYINTTGNPCLAKGGSGDVLAGMTAGIWAQAGHAAGFEKTAMASARLAVYLHGLCGDIAAAELGTRGVLARDLIARIPAAFKKASIL